MPAKISKFINNNKNSLIVGAILCFVGIFWLIIMFGENFTLHSTNESNRKALLEIRNNIQLGDGYEKTLQHFWTGNSKHSRLSISVYSAEEWMISMPSELFTTDWRMYIKFENSRVIGYKVRTSDGVKMPDMPEDIGKIDE